MKQTRIDTPERPYNLGDRVEFGRLFAGDVFGAPSVNDLRMVRLSEPIGDNVAVGHDGRMYSIQPTVYVVYYGPLINLVAKSGIVDKQMAGVERPVGRRDRGKRKLV